MKNFSLAFALMLFNVVGFAQPTPAGAPGFAGTQSLDEWFAAQSSEPQTLTDRAEFAFGKALGYTIGIGVLVLGIAVVRAKPWQWRPGPMPRTARIALVATAIWLLAVQLWGYIFGWDNYFGEARYAAIHLSVPLLSLAAWLGQRWIGRA